MASQRQAFAVNELTDENQMLSEALTHSRKQAELYENNMEQITREYRKKINEANNAKLESDLRHRNTEHDTVKRFANYRNTEAEAIAHLRFESSVSSNAREKMEHYEMLYDNERALTNELKTEIEDRNVKLRRSLQEGPMAIGHGSNQHAIQHLETEVKVAQVRAQDLSEEMDECMYTNIRLKDELAEVSRQGSSTPFGSEVAILRTELESERKYKLATGAQQYERSCEYLGELRDRDEKLAAKDAEISRLRKGLIDAEVAIKSQESLNALPFSAGITNSGLSPYMIIGKLESEVEAANDESNILRAWIRQLDDELNTESATARANIAASAGQAHQQSSHPENRRISELLREVNKKVLDGKGVSIDEGAGIPDYRRPNGNDDPDFPDGPPDPNGPPGPPNPPGLPSLRGSQRDSAIDLESTTAFTAEEPPRISRREADKVYISPWPKHQNLGVWQSDLIKSVCLAANDGDRAAWEAWLQPALRQNPDIDALNDSGGQRYQSIDAKLSIALSNVISQAGDVARHVAIKLRLRTQASNRRATFVMGREILAMILEHFRTPGQRETAFTMEHIIQSRYLGDANIETFYEKWMEIVSNMMPEDVPQDDWLRDALYKKIRNSNLMMYDIKQYESWLEGDPRRTYQYLINAIERHIARIREDKHVAAWESMPEILLAEVGRLRLLLLLQLLLMQTPKRKQRPMQRRSLLQSPKRSLMPLLYYPHLNQSNMPKEKGKEEKGSQRAEVPVLVTRRRYHVTSISSRSLAEKERTVNTVMTKRHLMLARVVDMVKEAVKHQEDNLQQTRPRRSTSHAGTGQRANVDMATSATSDMMLTCSTLHQTPSLHHRKQPRHFSTTTVMWMSHPS